MAIRSQRQTFDRMISERRMSGPEKTYDDMDLEQLKKRLEVMYQYRNDDIRDVDAGNGVDHTTGQVQNVCHQHYYKSFKDYQTTMGVDYSLSLGDINDAIDALSYCTCNGRSIQACNCVSRSTGNTCDCNLRAPYQCNCYHRHGGKYDPECRVHCLKVTSVGCACVSRNAEVSCDCHGRCSCNIVNEYTMEPAPASCTCVSRSYGDPCRCHARTAPPAKPNYEGDASACPSKWNKKTDVCDCVNRTSQTLCEYHEKSYAYSTVLQKPF